MCFSHTLRSLTWSQRSLSHTIKLIKLQTNLKCSYFHTPSSCPSGGVRISSILEKSCLIACWMYWNILLYFASVNGHTHTNDYHACLILISEISSVNHAWMSLNHLVLIKKMSVNKIQASALLFSIKITVLQIGIIIRKTDFLTFIDPTHNELC